MSISRINYETNINVMIQNLDGTYNTAICIHDKDVDGEERKISFLWLSSPCSYSQSNVMITNSNGAVYSTLYSQTDCGFRPIISLASTVQLEEQEDGSFKIK